MFTIVSSYKEYIEGLPIVPVLESSFSTQITQIFIKKVSQRKIESKYELLKIWIIALPKFLFSYKVLLNKTYIIGLHLPFFLIARFFRKINKNVIIDNFYLHEISTNKVFRKFLKFILAGKEYTFIVQSKSEIEFYKNIAPKLNLIYLPYCMSKVEISHETPLPIKLPESYLFSGGYTNRDYDLILRAGKELKAHTFIIVMSRLNVLKEEVPSNVIILKDLNFDQFHLILARASCVIIPLKDNVGSSGQMLSLAAMQLGKPVIYSSNDTINHYFANGNGIPFEQNNLNSFIYALERFFSLTKNEKLEIQAKQKFTFDTNFETKNRLAKLIDIIISCK